MEQDRSFHGGMSALESADSMEFLEQTTSDISSRMKSRYAFRMMIMCAVSASGLLLSLSAIGGLNAALVPSPSDQHAGVRDCNMPRLCFTLCRAPDERACLLIAQVKKYVQNKLWFPHGQSR